MRKKRWEYESNRKEVEKRLDKAINKALKITGIQVKNKAKDLSPVDTGNLRQSIDDELNLIKKYVDVGTPVEYAQSVELGSYKQKAQPFLRPATDKSRLKINRMIRKIFRSDMR